jgi:hypothetical protein
MAKGSSAAKLVAHQLESKNYFFLICLLAGLGLGCLIFFILDGWQLVGGHVIHALKQLIFFTRGNAIFSWASGIFALLATFILLYIVIKHFLEKEDDPLFSPKATLLLMIVLMRLSVEVPNVHKTLSLAFRDTSGISQLVLLVMTIGLVTIFFQFLSLRQEFANFVIIRDRMAYQGEAEQWDPVKSLAIMEDAQGLLRAKWQNIKISIQKGLSSDYETLVSFPDQAELLKESKVSFIIKILPVLGMIGTVLGFTVAVVGMQAAAANMNDFNSFKGNLLDALGGMKSAFLTTLVGMVAMVLVMWVNALIDESRQRILLQEADFLYTRLFLPGKKYVSVKPGSPENSEHSPS